MLVLSRRRDEKIIVQTSDGPIVFTVCQVKGGAVRVGIDAPKKCKIMREELVRVSDDESEQALFFE